jgi:hypothetical protein
VTRDRLEFVGVISHRRDASDDWHQPNTLSAHLSPDAALLRALMDIDGTPGQERMRLLGG